MSELRPDLALVSEWIQPGSRILDLGCGDGTLLSHLKQQREVEGYGIEIDAENITRCIEAGINVIHSDLDSGLSDFDADSFDYVVMTQTLQAIQHPDQLLNEMLRVGRQGIVTFPNFGYWYCRLQLGLKGQLPVSRVLPYEWYNTPNIHIITIKEFEKLCRKQGVKILERAVVDHKHKRGLGLRLFPNLLGEIAIYRFERA